VDASYQVSLAAHAVQPIKPAADTRLYSIITVVLNRVRS